LSEKEYFDKIWMYLQIFDEPGTDLDTLMLKINYLKEYLADSMKKIIFGESQQGQHAA
jgi:hypothetical protein